MMNRWMCMVVVLAAACGGSGSTEAPSASDVEMASGRDEPDESPKPSEWSEPTAPCDSGTPPARCETSAGGFQWGQAAIVTSFVLEGADEEPICCVDMTGDDEIDNSWGMNMAGFGQLSANNAGTASRIGRGADVVVLEFDDLSSSRPEIQWWRGRWVREMEELSDDGENRVEVLGVDRGVQSLSYIDEATVNDVAIAAAAGRIEIPIVLLNQALWVTTTVRGLSLYPEEEGDGLESRRLRGELGVVMDVHDFFAAANVVAAQCECLGLGDAPLVEPDTGLCSLRADAQACTDAGRPRCATWADSCSLFGAVGLFADVDADGDGFNDGVSMGYSIELAPAQIEGVAGPPVLDVPR